MRKSKRECLKMADAIDCQQQKLKTCKIECRSKRAVCNIVETIGGRALSVIKDFKELKEDEQERVKQRFKEIYETAVYQNVLIDGQNLCDLKNHDADETTEYEPIDLEKKKYINDTMVGKLDDAIVRTAQKRKHYPIKYKNKLKKLSNKTVSHLVSIKLF
ncbi:hypothetical protein KUTeg_013046 [Tegillarca granosa]|uniref:Uncharacterized protein n=1 Tax=Tegillarca granosa TaxID=220873 RepID=A0ABQ9EX29_TEGGR|nr:hypothetical protein KUTeg_013046 [Tegillarca granosa]